MTLPGQLTAEYTLKGIWCAAIALVIALLIAALAVQTARIEGFKVWPFETEGWKPKANRLQAALDRIPAAQEQARIKAETAKAAIERTYREIAQEVDDHAEDETRRELAAADRYIATHRVRPQADPDRSGRAAAPTGDQGAGYGKEAGQTAELDDAGGGADISSGGNLVAVSAEDVRICTVNTLQAEAARSWAIELEAVSSTAPLAD